MKVPSAGKKQGVHFNLTPLIDVVFLLIIFFLVSSHFVRTEAGVEVKLPSMKLSEAASPLPNDLVITVTKNMSWYINKSEYQMDEIKNKILNELKVTPDLVIKLRCDEEVKFSVVEPFIRFCQSQDVSEIQFATKKVNR
jgi:biopolymer transport protein ExbD